MKSQNPKKYILFTCDGTACPIFYKLFQEGNDVLVAQVQDKSELEDEDVKKDKEDPDTKKRRLAVYEGVLPKKPASKVIEMLKQVKDHENYSIHFDMNSLWKYSEEVLKIGFKQGGTFPTKEDYSFEKDRKKSKEFIKKHYNFDELENHEFGSTDEVEDFLEDTEDIWVMQSEGDHVETVVPKSDNPELARRILLDNLESQKKDYNKGKIILTKKLIHAIEVTPCSYWVDGELIFTNVDIETKNLGAGKNNAPQVGCGSNLIIQTEINEKINEIAFPPIVADMAGKHTGLFSWDISMYFDPETGKIYPGEFCPNRWGYDSFPTEVAMAGGATNYFEKLIKGENPIQYKFGAAVRIFNMRKDDDGKIKEDLGIYFTEDSEPDIYVYEMKADKDKLVNTGSAWDFAVITGVGDTIKEAVDRCYESAEEICLDDSYKRPKFDFISRDYETSIMNRFDFINHKYIEAPDFKDEDDEALDLLDKMLADDK